MKKLFLSLGAMICVLLLAAPAAFVFARPALYSYSSDLYQVKADSVIRSLIVNGTNICAKYQIFQCEENHQQYWKLEAVKHYVAPKTDGIKNILLTQSSLYLFDVLKKYTFFPDHFTVNISKCYTRTGFDENNQIIVDVLPGYITVNVLWSNCPVSYQSPFTGMTEMQWNINNQSDETVAYHVAGTIETVLFEVTI